MKPLRRAGLGVGLALTCLWFANTSMFHGGHGAAPQVLAHRGVHQSYIGPAPGNDTCTAKPIATPTHGFIENTLPSMEAAFAAGASVVEIDVHRTTDGQFAVFHDWTLSCRTDGTGQTNQKTMAELKALDAGWGYATADGSYPIRGTGMGAIPTLDEVFDTFPAGRFLINFKSNDPTEGVALAREIAAAPSRLGQIFGVYGGAAPVAAFRLSHPQVPGFTWASVKRCLGRYIALGWSGRVPKACRDTQVMVPVNYAPLFWGWPHVFVDRMNAAGTDVILAGPYERDRSTQGIDTAELARKIPAGFGDYVWTNDMSALGLGLAHPTK